MKNKKPLKDRQTNVRLTAEEYLILKEKADKLNLSMSKYIRQIAVNGFAFNLSKPKQVEPEITENSGSVLNKSMLIKAFNNLNQIARYTNTHRQVHKENLALIKTIEKLLSAYKS